MARHRRVRPHGHGGDNRYCGRYCYAYHPPTVMMNFGGGCYNCRGWNAGGAWATGAFGAAASQPYPTNDIYPALPAECFDQIVGPLAHYRCGGTWFISSYGANGAYYRVAPAP